MIDKLSFKFGSVVGGKALEAEVAPITVFVGPNNSGKSRALLEIDSLCCRNLFPHEIVDKVTFTPWNPAEFEKVLAGITVAAEPDDRASRADIVIATTDPIERRALRTVVVARHLRAEATDPSDPIYYHSFLELVTLRLDGASRLNLVDERDVGDLQRTASNHVARLFADDAIRAKLRRIVHDAFQRHLVVDPTNIGHLRLRLSDRAPVDEREERGWDDAAVKFHGAAIDLKDASDGVKAFVGIMSTLLAGDPRITLIDEPEAFLHPSLAASLGKEIGQFLRGTNRRLFASTHSAAFLMGCIQSGSPLSIIRLTYNYNSPTARVLPQEKIVHLMRNPLLRSIGVLNGLFYESVIVTEGDSDRAFYQEVNERLLAAADPRGIANCLFLNAQNKQTVWEIVRPLRELGIPAAGIIDIDVLKEGGKVWAKPLAGAFIPELQRSSLQKQREGLLAAFTRTKKDMKREGGIALLTGSDREACQNVFDSLAGYGVFVVSGGELESWLKHLGVVGHGSEWLIKMFERLGEQPEQRGYIVPTTGDVWDFIGAVKTWIAAPARKGIPS